MTFWKGGLPSESGQYLVARRFEATLDSDVSFEVEPFANREFEPSPWREDMEFLAWAGIPELPEGGADEPAIRSPEGGIE